MFLRIKSRLFQRSARSRPGLFARLIRDTRGSTLIFVVSAIIPMMAFMGIAADMGRGYLVKARLSSALDAAALAAGKEIFSPDPTAVATKYFNVNFPPGFMNATVIGPAVTIGPNQENVTITASASIPTTLVSLLGFSDLVVSARTVVNRENRGMELVLILDNTGSMNSGGKIQALKTAATDLINILYGSDETHPNFWIGLVPYVTTVNVGAQHDDWLELPPVGFAPDNWKGCMRARLDGDFDLTDEPPAIRRFDPYLYASAPDNIWPEIVPPSSNWGSVPGKGPNLGCPDPVLPLTAEKSTVQAAVDAMRPWMVGGTLGNLGLVWGWRALSPNWRGLWGGDLSLPLDYGEPLTDKVVVMLTDGQNQLWDHHTSGPEGWDYNGYSIPPGPEDANYNSYGRLKNPPWTATTVKDWIDNRMSVVCESMKAQGIIIFTITFQGGNEDLFRNCATSPQHYFNSPTNADLQIAFRSIGQVLSNLRLAE